MDFKVKMEEEIFLYVNYKEQSNYVKISFKYNDDYHLVFVKEMISAAFEGFLVDDCNFYWDEVLIPENDLVPLIKAKQTCGHFRINIKEKRVLKEIEIEDAAPAVDVVPAFVSIPVVDADPADDVICLDQVEDVKPQFLETDREYFPEGSSLFIDDTNIDDSMSAHELDETTNDNLFVIKEPRSVPAESFIPSAKRYRSKFTKEMNASVANHIKMQVDKLREYFNASVHTRLLLIDDPMKPTNRKGIVSCAVKYLFQECGLYPDSSQRNHLSVILVELFKQFKPDEDLVKRWIHDKVANMRKKMKRENENFSKLLERSKKRRREDFDEQEESDCEFDSSRSFSGFTSLSVTRFKEFINADIQYIVLLSQDHTEPSIRKKIISCSVKFLFNECGMYPSLSQKRALQQLICEVFTGLSNEEEQVKRWLMEKIKNYRKKTKLDEESYYKCLDREKMLTGEDRVHDHLEFLETCLEVDDIPRIEKALTETMSFRLTQYSNSEFNVFHAYKFFSKSLELILYEFGIRFPSVQDNLLDNFELILDAACNVYALETKQEYPEEDYSMELRKLLTICHYTKTPTGPRKHYTIPDMIDALISFSIIDDDVKPEFKDHPMIVAQGNSKKEIWKYFIQVESALIELPEQTKFIGAFDYLIRSYYVFNVEFPKVLSVFMNFIMINVYDITVKSKYDLKKMKIDDIHSRPRDFWRKVQKHINDMK